MMHGLPVIASRIGGLGELVEEGKTGLLFEPGNANDLASKINMLWNNPKLCNTMGQAGRAKAMQEYSEPAYTKGLMEIYQQAINRARQTTKPATSQTTMRPISNKTVPI